MNEDRILSVKETITLVSLSRSQIWRLEKIRQFPRRLHVSTNRTGYLYSEVQAWIRDKASMRHE